jgi:hypothetical protein
MRKRKRGVSLTCIEEFGPELRFYIFLVAGCNCCKKEQYLYNLAGVYSQSSR